MIRVESPTSAAAGQIKGEGYPHFARPVLIALKVAEGDGRVTAEAERKSVRGILGLGATYAVTENTVLDAGVNIGLSGDADDVNLLTGLTVRF